MRTPVLDGLLKFVNEGVVPFYMPGHKNNRRGFLELDIIKNFLYEIDNTEVPNLDNLHIPEGMIKEAQELAARAFKAGKTYFLINGSTSGNYAMIMGVTRPKDKIIIQRNCHRSVYTAALLGDLEIAYIKPIVLPDFNCAVSVTVEDTIRAMEENREAKAVVITYPSYYGTCSDLGRIIREANKRGMLVLVDEAHGAHFPFNKSLPLSAMELNADISVNSIHKTLPALTQTSILNIRKGLNLANVGFMTSAFQSTSPSYVLMASIDAARAIMEDRGSKLLDELILNVDNFKDRVRQLKSFSLIDSFKGEYGIYDIDRTRITIRARMGGRFLEELLRKKYKIQVEMSDLNNVVLIGSVGDRETDYNKLYNALCEIDKEYDFENCDINIKVPDFKRVLGLKEAYYTNKRSVKIKESLGKISGEMVVPYPPGIPLIVPGEEITGEIIEYIDVLKKIGIPLNGIEDKRIEYINVLDI